VFRISRHHIPYFTPLNSAFYVEYFRNIRYPVSMTTTTLYPRNIRPRIVEAQADTAVILLAGLRQAGKTTLVRQIAARQMKTIGKKTETGNCQVNKCLPVFHCANRIWTAAEKLYMLWVWTAAKKLGFEGVAPLNDRRDSNPKQKRRCDRR